jgi:elongation factor Ts
MGISASMVKELRTQTGAGMMDCKKALTESNGDMEKAVEYLRVKGIAKAQKKSTRATTEGLIVSYIHPGNKIGVLLEVNCETDFVARTDEFQAFVKDIAMQVAATSPLAINREDLPEEVVSKERELFTSEMREENKPEHVIEKIVEGKMEKFYTENCLMDQVYVKDSDMKIRNLVEQIIAKIGENIRINRFSRFQLGR